MSPNVKLNQPHETTSVKHEPADDTSPRPRKRERTDGDVTPKSEPSQAEVKEEPGEQEESDGPAPPELQEELRRAREDFPPPSSSDTTPRQAEVSIGPTGVFPVTHRTIWISFDRDAVASEKPLTQIRSELWTIQANLETLRT